MVLRVAIIGLGRIGYQLEKDKRREKPCTHLGSWLALEKEGLVNITGLCDTDKDRLREAGDVFEKRGSPVIQETDHHELLKGEARPEIVSIATPTETHYDIALNCIGAGVKGIFLEKPICEDTVQADELLEKVKESGVKLAVNHTRRYDPFWQKLRQEVVVEKKIGESLRFVGIFSGDRLKDGVHMADLANWFSNIEPLLLNQPTPYLLFEVDIIGSKGRLQVENNGASAWWSKSYASTRYEGYEELRMMDNVFANNHRVDGLTPMLLACKDLVECVEEEKDSSREPLCTGTDGLLALGMVLE